MFGPAFVVNEQEAFKKAPVSGPPRRVRGDRPKKIASIRLEEASLTEELYLGAIG